MPTPAHTPRFRPVPLRRTALAFFTCFCLLGPVCIAQPATNFIANSPLPLRNVLIEVRQVQSNETHNDALESSGALHINNTGDVAVQGQLHARQGQQRQFDSAVQQVLVLNGRSAHIHLGNRTPMRVVQTLVRNGTLIVVPTTLLWETGTGFNAIPRWDGSNRVELELGAQQASGASAVTGSGADGRPTFQMTTSTLAIALGTWVTVARSDTQSEGQRGDLSGNTRWNAQANSEVQVRLTLP
jgi:hypothetical protein